MSFDETLARVVELLRRQGCVSYRALKLRFDLDDEYMEGLKEELVYAQQLAHPLSLTMALRWAAVLHHLRWEAPLTQARAEAAIIMATDQGFPRQVQGEEGIAQIHQGLTACRATGAPQDRPEHLALLAQASAQVGRTAEGLVALAQALATLEQSEVRLWEAELYRLKGELLLQHSVAQPEEAEACFQQALAIARRQQAKSLELRAAMSLSRLWQRQGKHDAARELLAPIYARFT
jgi:predicted ATPase